MDLPSEETRDRISKSPEAFSIGIELLGLRRSVIARRLELRAIQDDIDMLVESDCAGALVIELCSKRTALSQEHARDLRKLLHLMKRFRDALAAIGISDEQIKLCQAESWPY